MKTKLAINDIYIYQNIKSIPDQYFLWYFLFIIKKHLKLGIIEMCAKFLLKIQTYLSKYFELSGNIEKYFVLGLWIFFMGFYFDYERLWLVFEILELLFEKRLKLTKKSLMVNIFKILLVDFKICPRLICFSLPLWVKKSAISGDKSMMLFGICLQFVKVIKH